MPSLGTKIKRIGSRKRDKNSPRNSLSASSDQSSTLSGEPSLERPSERPSERSPAPAPQFAPPATPKGREQASQPEFKKPFPSSSESIDSPMPQSSLDRATPEQPLEIKTSGGKTFVFKPKLALSQPASPAASPVATGAAGPKKHTQFVEPSRPLERSASLAQLAREKKSSSFNDTRHFYSTSSSLNVEQHAARPSLSRKSSYADDRRALEYMSKKGTAEGSNLLYRTGSRIWDANKESGWFAYDASSRISSGRPSRRTSVAGSVAGSVESDVDSDSSSEEDLHPGRYMSPQHYDVDDEAEPEFADSYLIRAADWLLGIPHDSPMTLRNSLKKRPKKLSLGEKRRYREATVTDDPAFLLAAYLSLKELM